MAPVCDLENNYFHLTENGTRAYATNFKYVGDFKNGTAVVYDQEGFAHQIDNHGLFIDNRKYRSFWPFHKGFAIAEDSDGFFHINTNGEDAYSARYRWVEPFYNGL